MDPVASGQRFTDVGSLSRLPHSLDVAPVVVYPVAVTVVATGAIEATGDDVI